MTALCQTELAAGIAFAGAHGGVSLYRAEFMDPPTARQFYDNASREFPEDDVSLWTSVDPSTKGR